MRNGYGRRWWWYLDRFYREGVGMTTGEVHEQVLRMRRAREEEQRRLLHVYDERPPRETPAAEAANGGPPSPSIEEDLKPSRRAPAESPETPAAR
jgi:hypothetical protein